MKIRYVPMRFKAATLSVIRRANEIIDEFQALGITLTVRGLYYQFVGRDWFPDNRTWTWTGKSWRKDPKGTKNAQPNYDWLQAIMTNARLAGLVSWLALEDRTRNLLTHSHWETPADLIRSAAEQFRVDRWAEQKRRVEVWVEKDAQASTIQPHCSDLDVPFFACRGYVSASEMWETSNRLRGYIDGGQEVVIIHLGDHDPSGMDMTRDIRDRLEIFLKHRAADLTINRIALNMDQVKKYNPPPNPAKTTDCRFKTYRDEYGDESWELDALNPQMLINLVRERIQSYVNPKLLKMAETEERRGRERLTSVSEHWDKATAAVDKAKKRKRK